MPKALAYQKLLAALFEQGRIDDAYNQFLVFHESVKAGNIDTTAQAVIVAYHKVLSGLAKNSRMDEAYKLLREMKEIGLTPDESSYMPFLLHCLRSQDPHDLFKLAGELQRTGTDPDTQLYGELLLMLLRTPRKALADRLGSDPNIISDTKGYRFLLEELRQLRSTKRELLQQSPARRSTDQTERLPLHPDVTF